MLSDVDLIDDVDSIDEAVDQSEGMSSAGIDEVVAHFRRIIDSEFGPA